MWFSRNQAPERAFAAMVILEAAQVDTMRLEAAEILDPIGQALALV